MAKDIIFEEPGFETSDFGPPNQPGVYAICVTPYWRGAPKVVVYIGSSKDICKRVNNRCHVYRRLFSLLRNYLVFTVFHECSNYTELERILIKKYHPRFNIQHNG